MTSPVEIFDGQTESHRRWSVQAFLVWLVVACLLPGIIAAVILLIHEYREGLSQLETDNIQTARALIQAVDNHILRAQALAQGLATDSSLAVGDLAQFHKRARQALEQSKLGTSVVLTDKTGQQVSNTRKEFGQALPQHGNEEMVRRVFETGKPVFSDLFVGAVVGRSIMAVAVPVFANGKIIYVLSISVPPEQFNAILSAQGLPPGWLAVILDSTSTIVARSRESDKYRGQKPAAAYLQRVEESNEGVLEFTMKDGVPVRSHYTRSPLTRWWVAVNIPMETLHGQLFRRFFVMVLIVLGLFAIGLALAWSVGGKISRSVRALVAPASALGAGEPVFLPSVDVKEAAEVTHALGEAAVLLRWRTAALQESEALFGRLTDTLPGFVFVADADGKSTYVNSAFVSYTGLAYESVMGDGWARAMHPEDLERARRIWDETVARGAHYQGENRFRRHDGIYRWYLCCTAPMIDPESGRVARWIGVAIDMDDRKHAEAEIQRLNADLERRVEARTAELTAANRELEGFTFATSHDLRGPLGRINSFSAMLEERYRERLEGDGLVFLDVIRQNAIRLNHLVDDLLVHARVAQQNLELQPIDVGSVVQAVLADKADEIHDAGAEIKHELGPVAVQGDTHALTQALNNLVQNALKYSHPARPPVIEIGGQESDGRFLVWVRDNGIGFDMAYHDKIFEIFRRLHTYTEYKGNGIGLALVKRAMERMGGRVWAQSMPGHGTTFFLEFQLPVQ